MAISNKTVANAVRAMNASMIGKGAGGEAKLAFSLAVKRAKEELKKTLAQLKEAKVAQAKNLAKTMGDSATEEVAAIEAAYKEAVASF